MKDKIWWKLFIDKQIYQIFFMKVLYANPIFLDYRIPFFKKLVELFNGEFYILYSTQRYKGRFDDLLKRIPNELGRNAIAYENEKIFYFNSLSFKYKAKASEKKKKLFPYAIPFAFGLLKTVKRQRPDVLITEGFYQWTPLICRYAHKHKVPLYLSYERTLYTERNVGKLKTLERKWIDKFIAGYLVNGRATSEYLLSLGVSPDRIFIAGMSADSDGLRQAIMNFPESEKIYFRKKYQRDKGLIFLFSGQMIVRKGVDHLLESWMQHIKKFPFDKLILIGGGPLYDQYFQRYCSVPSIFLEGRIPYSEVYKYYAIADVFILPTIEDNWSLVVPEAMACGLPIATSIYNGCHYELVQKGINGITFDTFRHDTIIDALEYFHTQNLDEFGKNSIRLEELFNTDNSAKRVYYTIVNSCMSK